jgi:hypothetical protein
MGCNNSSLVGVTHPIKIGSRPITASTATPSPLKEPGIDELSVHPPNRNLNHHQGFQESLLKMPTKTKTSCMDLLPLTFSANSSKMILNPSCKMLGTNQTQSTTLSTGVFSFPSKNENHLTPDLTPKAETPTTQKLICSLFPGSNSGCCQEFDQKIRSKSEMNKASYDSLKILTDKLSKLSSTDYQSSLKPIDSPLQKTDPNFLVEGGTLTSPLLVLDVKSNGRSLDKGNFACFTEKIEAGILREKDGLTTPKKNWMAVKSPCSISTRKRKLVEQYSVGNPKIKSSGEDSQSAPKMVS